MQEKIQVDDKGPSLLETEPRTKLPCRLKWETWMYQGFVKADVQNRNTHCMLVVDILRAKNVL